jgi:23S rRNA pseudouridine2604 synthase
MKKNNNAPDDEGIRLAKRVAALAGVSRREAELLIENGAVRVDGVPAVLPQSRVQAHQQVEIAAGAKPEPVVPVTMLLYKPAGMPTDNATGCWWPRTITSPNAPASASCLRT